MKGALAGFKEFVLRGNVVDLAVGVVIGAAFSGVVTALVEDFINPLIGAIFGKPDLTDLWDITLRAAHGDVPAAVISVGGVLNAVLQFLIIAAALYFVVVLPMNRLAARRTRNIEPEPETPAEDVLVLREIRDLLSARSAGGPSSGTPPRV
ncbi:large conductance mechanosensitive channel protein MscL [Cellulosimicrobium terreum]|nr:large conductance mechanosensitive channel protein MscL [Cellulosimicrobium terreum]